LVSIAADAFDRANFCSAGLQPQEDEDARSRRSPLKTIAAIGIFPYAIASCAEDFRDSGKVKIEQVEIVFIGSSDPGGGTLGSIAWNNAVRSSTSQPFALSLIAASGPVRFSCPALSSWLDRQLWRGFQRAPVVRPRSIRFAPNLSVLGSRAFAR
jgi:hypothetical protein